MHTFLSQNREELIERCKRKVAGRPARGASDVQLADGVPLFIEQLRQTLKAEEEGQVDVSLRISGGPAGDAMSLSEIGLGATAHGKRLSELGYTVDQVVHDYGDLCQAITDLAVERKAPFSVEEFRTLNRCLDNAIADAVAEFSFQHENANSRERDAVANERIGFLIHEMRNQTATAVLAFGALEGGHLAIGGATGGVLKRSLASLSNLIKRSLGEYAGRTKRRQLFTVSKFIADAQSAALLDAQAFGCTLQVPPVDPLLCISGDRELLLGALANLLQNAFRFTHGGTCCTLRAHAFGEDVLIDVEDRCGGLPPGSVERMFTPMRQRPDHKSGLGLGLSIARQSIEADLGYLSVRDVPGTGCIFTIRLPRHGNI